MNAFGSGFHGESRIFLIHGVVRKPDPTAFVHRNMLCEDWFVNHLRLRRPRYVGLREALAGRGDALTIDDATKAGARGAELARLHGHEVTMFINPGNVDGAIPYYFLVLNSLLDFSRKERVEFDGSSYSLTSLTLRRRFRRIVRDQLARCDKEREREDLLQSLGEALEAPLGEIPVSSQVLTTADISDLRDSGVTIGNHAWNHGDLTGRKEAYIRREISLARRWIADELGVKSPPFAVPFGRTTPEREVLKEAGNLWLLADSNLFEGWLGPGIFNRVTLEAL